MAKYKRRNTAPKFKSPDEMQAKINEYFISGVKEKTVQVGRKQDNKYMTIKVPTITGLALYLGFASVSSLYDYEKKQPFQSTVKRARSRIIQHYEELLQTGNTIGAIFALKNFGWKDKQEIDNTHSITLADSITEMLRTKGKQAQDKAKKG